MKKPSLSFPLSFFLLVALALSACRAETAAPPAPPPTEVTFLTDPTQAAVEAATVVPTFTPNPSPQPTPTNTPLPTATIAPSPTPSPEPVVSVNEGDTTPINVRAGPGTNYPVVGRFTPGQEAIVTGRNEDASWWQIELAEAGGEAETGWVFAELTTRFDGEGQIPLVETPPPPPAPTPDPDAVAQAEADDAGAGDDNQADAAQPPSPAELADQLRCGKDFCITYQAMVPIWENGGCIGNHSIFVTVLQGLPPGRPMDGVVIGDTFGNIEVASGAKGPGFVEVTLWNNSMSLKVKRNIDGTPYTSEESFPFTASDELIPAEVLAANGYCDGNVERCRWAQQNNQICRGHYSWRVTFHKFD